MIITYQDLQTMGLNSSSAVEQIIENHRISREYQTAVDADRYDRQNNTTIMRFAKYIYSPQGEKSIDSISANHKLCSNIFRRLNTQRTAYSLGNGVTFEGANTKAKLGIDFDSKLRSAAYYSLIHGISFVFWNLNHIHVFPLTEFAPVWDEETGALRAGVRYWQIDSNKPVMAVLYEEDGFTKLKGDNSGNQFKVIEEKRAYKFKTRRAAADSEAEIIGAENYGSLPIIPFYGSNLKQSTLVGLKSKIDAFDLIQSGFCNDLAECAEVYWLVTNAGGMDDEDLANFRNRLKLNHIANVEDADDVKLQPFTQEIPTTARSTFLTEIRKSIYEDFGALDCSQISAGARTATEINAAYQPMDENADDFEYQLIDGIQHLLALQNIEDTPIFKRNRISNQMEQTNMIITASPFLDDETVLNKLPFLTPDEVAGIMERKDIEDNERLLNQEKETEEVIEVE